MIRGYNISYGLTTQSPSDYVNLSTSVTEIELTSLEKFKEYRVIVNAFTIAAGPVETVIVQTDSDSELGTELSNQGTIISGLV